MSEPMRRYFMQIYLKESEEQIQKWWINVVRIRGGREGAIDLSTQIFILAFLM